MIVREQYRIEEKLTESIRFVDFCIGLFASLKTRNAVKTAIKREELWVNDVLATTGQWMQLGDLIQWVDPEKGVPKSFPMAIEVLFEDDFLAIVQKPSGIVVSGNIHRTLEHALIGKLQPSLQPDALSWARPVHRLDNPTSGIVVFAKTAQTHRDLMGLFAAKAVRKRYEAIVVGKLEKAFEATDPIEGRVAISTIEPIQSVPSLRNEWVSWISLSPITGRTHQLRIHCANHGNPIVGDTIYGEEGKTLLHKGLFLSAVEIEFIHPITGKMVHWNTDTPTKFVRFMEREQERYERFRST